MIMKRNVFFWALTVLVFLILAGYGIYTRLKLSVTPTTIPVSLTGIIKKVTPTDPKSFQYIIELEKPYANLNKIPLVSVDNNVDSQVKQNIGSNVTLYGTLEEKEDKSKYFFIEKLTTNQTQQVNVSPSLVPDTASAIAAFLAKKYQKPVSDVHVTVSKEVPGFAAGSVLFGQGGPGEGGMWLAVLGNGWEVVWDGNGNVDCQKMRTEYGFPDTILKPNFCD